VIDRGSGQISLVNRLSGRALDVWEASTADGARISQWDSHGGANQRFQLVQVG
jgi:alpha-L-fucosidase 2